MLDLWCVKTAVQLFQEMMKHCSVALESHIAIHTAFMNATIRRDELLILIWEISS